jgi:glycosyltransferase involved in cell wall biosynthesis
MHVGVDARELLGRPTGVGRLLSAILREWSAPDVGVRFTLFAPAALPAWASQLGPRFVTAIAASASAGTLWEQRALPRLAAETKVDVLFSPAYTAPLRLACPNVLAVHDLSYFAHPEWFSWREGLRRRWLTRASARRARAVVTISEFSSSEIQRWTGVPADRIHVVRLGGPAIDEHSDPTTRPPLILFVGSLFNRRHIPDLISAFARVVTRVADARLVLVGDNRTAPPLDPQALATSAGVGDRVEWRAYVPDAELTGLYGAARVFAFLSNYEGFAMTPLEALAHGVAPVLLDTPVAREVYADAALFVPPDVDAISAALVDLLTDADRRTRLLANGKRLIASRSWRQTAADVLRVIEGAR